MSARARTRRRRSGGAISAIATLGAIVSLWLPAGAEAATTHVLDETVAPGIGSLGTAAVHEATGDIYVYRLVIGDTRIYRFDSEWNPKPFPLLPNGYIDGAGQGQADAGTGPWLMLGQLAVDNSGDPNDGLLYVGTNLMGGVNVFTPQGRFTGLINTATEVFNQEIIGCAVATNRAGGVFVYSAHDRFGYVERYSPGEWNPFAFPLQTWPVLATLTHLPRVACRIGVDSTNAVYVKEGSGNPLLAAPVYRYPEALFGRREPRGTLIAPSVHDFAIDQLHDEVYLVESTSVANESLITRRTRSGELIEIIGPVFASVGLAFDSSTGTLYVTDRLGSVRVYESVTTPDITEVSADPARVDATISAKLGTAGAGDITECRVEFGTTDAYGESVPCDQSPPYEGTQAVTASLSGLTPETTYHYRVVAGNADGENATLDRTFRTSAVLGVQTLDPEVTMTTAKLRGSFLGEGDPVTYRFEWGETDAYGNSTDDVELSGPSGPTEVEASLADLDAYTSQGGTYHYRLVVTGPDGTTHGPDVEFTTEPPLTPTVGAAAVASLSPTEATLSATVNPSLGTTIHRADYGTSPAFGTSTPAGAPLDGDGDDHLVDVQLTGLEPNTTYHARIVATNFTGTTVGPPVSFLTPGPPSLLGGEVLSAGEREAVVSASVRPGSKPTRYRVEWGPTAAYGSSTAPATVAAGDNEPHTVAAALDGLAPGTNYHYRFVVSNEHGSAIGAAGTFTTMAATPPVPPADRGGPACRKGFVVKNGRCVRRACGRNRVRRKGRCVKKKKSAKRRGKTRRGSRG